MLKKYKKQFIYIIIYSIIITITLLFINSLRTRKKLENSLTLKKSIKSYYGQLSKKYPNANITIINDVSRKPYSVKLVKDFEIESTEKTVFFKVNGVKADKHGNIFVGERSEGVIYKFDSKGAFLLSFGQEGRGPGEISTLFTMTIDTMGFVHVYDMGNSRITVFSNDGKYIETINISGSGDINMVPSIIKHKDHYYISSLNNTNDTIINKIDLNGKKISEIGESDFWEEAKTNRSLYGLRLNYSNGVLCIYNNSLIFSQFNPFEIKKFDMSGRLKSIILKKDKHFPRAGYKLLPGGKLGLAPQARSSAVGIWNDLLVNCIYIPTRLKKDDVGCIVDFFSTDDELVASGKINKSFYVSDISDKGYLYGLIVDDDGSIKIAKYTMQINN